LRRKKLGPCIYLSFAPIHNSGANTQNPIANTITMYMSYSLTQESNAEGEGDLRRGGGWEWGSVKPAI
jgi:hypothetical protein